MPRMRHILCSFLLLAVFCFTALAQQQLRPGMRRQELNRRGLNGPMGQRNNGFGHDSPFGSGSNSGLRRPPSHAGPASTSAKKDSDDDQDVDDHEDSDDNSAADDSADKDDEAGDANDADEHSGTTISLPAKELLSSQTQAASPSSEAGSSASGATGSEAKGDAGSARSGKRSKRRKKDADSGGAKESDSSPVWAVLVNNGSVRAMKGERLQIADMKSKRNSLAFAQGYILSSLLQSGANQATMSALARTNSFMGQTFINSAGGSLSDAMGLFGRTKMNNTYVWGLPGGSASTVAPDEATFEVHYNEVPGVNPDEFQPAIVQLSTTSDNWRRIGETRTKSQMPQDDQPADVISSFGETRVAAQVTVLGKGEARIVASHLQKGQYALVVRPVSGRMKVISSDVVSGEGTGALLGSLWAFRVE